MLGEIIPMTAPSYMVVVYTYCIADAKQKKEMITSSVYDCTVEDVEYIYNKLSIHIFNGKSRRSRYFRAWSASCFRLSIISVFLFSFIAEPQS